MNSRVTSSKSSNSVISNQRTLATMVVVIKEQERGSGSVLVVSLAIAV